MLKGFMVKERLGTPGLQCRETLVEKISKAIARLGKEIRSGNKWPVSVLKIVRDFICEVSRSYFAWRIVPYIRQVATFCGSEISWWKCNSWKMYWFLVRVMKLQDHFLLTRRTEPVGVKQDLHSLQASGKSHNVHLWHVPRFGLLQNRMDTKDPVPSSIGAVITRNAWLAVWGGSVYTTPSGLAQGRGLPLCMVEGNEVGPLTSSTPRATDLSPLCGRFMPRKRLHQFNRRLCKRPSRFETRSCFQVY